MGNNSTEWFWLGAIAVILLCGGAAFGLPYFLGPEADARAEMMLRTPTATPPPTPNPTVVAEQDLALTKVYHTGGNAGIVLIVVVVLAACVFVGSWAARAGAAAGVKVKAMRALPPWETLPDKAVLLGMPGGHEAYDPRFGSVRTLGVGDALPCLEQGELLVNQRHPVVDVVTALLQVPVASRGEAWRRAAQHHNLLEDGHEA